jgi:hypothetical protein
VFPIAREIFDLDRSDFPPSPEGLLGAHLPLSLFSGQRIAMKKYLVISGLIVLLSSTLSVGSFAQTKKDPLTEQQIEEVREAGDQPAVRIKLYVGYVEQRTKEIQSIDKDAGALNKVTRTHDLLEEFTRLVDELQDNMDAFDEQHADMRKVLKEIVDKSAEWTGVLNEPKPAGQYDFARKTALDANQSVHEASKKMLDDQLKYFAEKKKEEKEQQKKLEQEEKNSETR